MIYVCFAYGLKDCTPTHQDYERYTSANSAWDGIHKVLRTWIDDENEWCGDIETDDFTFVKPMLNFLTPQQVRNWEDGTVTFESHMLALSGNTGDALYVILMSREDWERERAENTTYTIELVEHEDDDHAQSRRELAGIIDEIGVTDVLNDYMGVPTILDDYHMHEALDRVHMVSVLFDEVFSHPSIQADRVWLELAHDISHKLAELHHLIGDKHLPD